ncbi:family 18 glycosyl hydrolase [Pseudomassariella vexata]|uniref:chitinase n=1 Tax=Pseudomassariella vexata TaxID=1141098 RepID=A0A1Y2EIJ1_9PEZI|nr:family 18 glycosyl hydrolase [Pseudomassariella vexata]ORY71398.1 family 18 glycosyl hydrolase [Pseudomassariella vexata]
MKITASFTTGVTLAGCALADCGSSLRNIMYFDQYHLTTPTKDVTGGITHVITAFANSSLFVGATPGNYTPFMPLADVRALFDNGTKVGIAIGGWGDTEGFGAGAKTEETRKQYAINVAAMATSHGFDFVDVDWEYPGGNGPDYKQIPNANKTDEITTFPLFLQEIKDAISPKELSIAVPGLERDMIAFTQEQAPKIFAAVDFVNVMTYDLMSRRDNATLHHSDVAGSLASVERYLSLGLDASKINLGFAFYAKFFQTQPGVDCSATPVGCPIVLAELEDGSDAGTSGATTFEKSNVVLPVIPTNLTVTSDGSCGINTFNTCLGAPENATCCSQYGYCGSTAAHCGTGCQLGYGNCEGPSTATSFVAALANSTTDEENGGEWWWDAENELFWTFDTVELMQRKFDEIVAAKGLGGVMAWSLGEDSYDWSRIAAMNAGVKKLQATKKRSTKKRRAVGQKLHA